MQPKSFFRVVVASFGLYIIYTGFHDLSTAVLYTLCGDEFKQGAFAQPGIYPRFFALRGAIEAVVGIVVTNGFIPLTSFAFPEKDEDDEADSPPTGQAPSKDRPSG
jgi:hypothetical protein